MLRNAGRQRLALFLELCSARLSVQSSRGDLLEVRILIALIVSGLLSQRGDESEQTYLLAKFILQCLSQDPLSHHLSHHGSHLGGFLLLTVVCVCRVRVRTS